MTIIAAHPNAVPTLQQRAAEGRVTRGGVWTALLFRLVGFAAVQAAVAAVFALRGAARPWASSVAWWPVSAIVVSAATLALLARAARREGLRPGDLLSARRDTVGRDLVWFLVGMLIAGPVGYLPGQWLSRALYGDAAVAPALMFGALPGAVAAAQLLLFPLLVALSELPAYFGYAMPRLAALTGRSWPAVALPVFFLAAQHATLPLIPDWRFIIWRTGMFLPFALLLAILLRRRPQLLPYLMAGQFLIDLPTAWFVYAA